ncbi:amidohydrolase family protein [Gramella sp. KN1008]|uniref:amidohydrolase family protein n=1 Tax=Gramella sp. KN1008 TaxID=2529298 RepID=UPI00103B4824|nr:amidohydrolase family protein [Gramella sp. KN1008]TBW29995.1 amidohydrolase [Gramella sp. KN1008]
MKTLNVLFCFLLLLIVPVHLRSQERLPVIDMHMHIGVPLDIPAGAPAPCLPYPCTGKGKATAGAQDNLRKTLEMMDEYNVVLGFLGDLDLELLPEWEAAAPERFILSPFILDPAQADKDLIRKKLEANEFQGIGEIGAQLRGIPPNDPRLEPFFAMAEEFDVPVLIHTAGIGPPLPDFRSSAGSPLLLEEVLTKHPKLRIYVENSGFPYLDEMVTMMYQYPQLYGDISTITWIISRRGFYDYLEKLMNAGLGKRLMFGSDQMIWPEMIGEGIEAIENADFLSEEEKRDILYNNAARFLRLEEK